ncbi:MAG: hypothetical protein ACYTFO_01750 [Planctomycetota bacterium]|jgi:hypothetical protein
MKRTIWLVVAAACAIGAGYGLSLAQEEEAPPVQLTAADVQVSAFDSLTVRPKESATVGATETLTKDGHVILLVSLMIDAPWSEELERVSVSGRDIALVGADDTQYPPFGYMQWGTFREFTPSVSLYRKSDWETEASPDEFNAAFLVPAEEASYTLVFGEHLSVPVTAPAQTVPEPHILDKMQIEILSAELVDELQSSLSVGEEKVPTDVVSQAGPFLKVTFKLVPLAPNGSYKTVFFWHSDWFGVRFADGAHSHTVGEEFMGGLSRNVSHNTPFTGDGSDSATATFYFPAAEGADAFELLVLMRTAAEGSVSP